MVKDCSLIDFINGPLCIERCNNDSKCTGVTVWRDQQSNNEFQYKCQMAKNSTTKSDVGKSHGKPKWFALSKQS